MDLSGGDARCGSSAATVVDLSVYDGDRIVAIDFAIDGDVRAEALRRQLRLGEGDRFVAAVWQDDVQQLMNRGVFASISTQAASTQDELCLVLAVRTNWFFLPYIGAQSGSVPLLILGANHGNVLGELIEVGGYYMRRGPYNLGRGWLVLPNLVTYGSLLDIEFVMTGELLLDYPSRANNSDGIQSNYRDLQRYRFTVPERGQEVLRRGMFADFGYQLVPKWLLLSARYVMLFETAYPLPNVRDVIAAEDLGHDVPALRRGPQEQSRLSLLSLTAIVGGVDLIDNYRYHGHEARLVLTESAPALGSRRNFSWLYAATRHFLNISGDLDFGGRVTYAHSTASDRRDYFSLGGYILEPLVYNARNPGVMTIRGFRESNFSGQNVFFVNAEPRYALVHDLQLPWVGGVSLTLAAYLDGGYAWQDSASAFADCYYSAGGGVLISLQNFRYTFINWYYAHAFRPFANDTLSIFLTRPFF